MLSNPSLTAMREHYARGEEAGRLDHGHGRLEFERTKEIVRRHLPRPPAVVADIGGGPGRYALWLAGLGYQVIHRDLMDLHVEQLRQAAQGSPLVDSAVGTHAGLTSRPAALTRSFCSGRCTTSSGAVTGCWP